MNKAITCLGIVHFYFPLNVHFYSIIYTNTEIDDVLIKVAALNDFYSTNIFSIYPVAKRIVEQDIDKKLKAGDLQLVNDIAKVTSADGKEHNFYSFATKYWICIVS